LVHFFGLPRERISVVLSGPGTLDDAQVKALESQPPRKNKKVFNFLFVGGGEERKNLETGLRIFNAFQKQCRQQCRLFVSGSLKRKSKILERLLKENPQNIIKLGYVSETAKIKYLKKCHFLLYPSFYEGFGFPVLEAQMFNTVPVIIKGSGVAEIGGQGIIEVNPASQEQELAVELLKVTNSPAGYRRLQELGRQNVQKYSWRRCAEEVRKILLNCSHKDNQ
jgi:glycosyltransferase involved in cell wall biosynthesis